LKEAEGVSHEPVDRFRAAHGGDHRRAGIRMTRFTRFWMTRLVVPLEVLVAVVIVSWFEPASLTAHAINATGVFGWGLVLLLAASCLAAMVDVAWNDLMPARFVLPTALKNRHLGFMGMAMTLAMIGFIVAYVHGWTPLLLVYWLNAVLAAAVCFMDLFARFRP
jgi:hypothetical protein